MKKEDREYYGYWSHLNVRVDFEYDADRLEVVFYETSQRPNLENQIFETLDEAKAYAFEDLIKREQILLKSIAELKEKLSGITEDSQEFIGYNPDGGW